MIYHVNTLLRALRHNLGDFKNPDNFKVTHRLSSVNDLGDFVDDYDLFLLDRDCTLQHYHGTERVLEFEETLQRISPKSEIISNSSFETFLGIRDVYGELFPINKLVRFSGFGSPHLLRILDGELLVYNSGFVDETSVFKGVGDSLLFDIEHDYDKPDPSVVNTVIGLNKEEGNIFENPRVLMVGDKYLTDIMAGNLAGVDTARVKPYKPLSDKFYLMLVRYFLDSPIGTIMSKNYS